MIDVLKMSGIRMWGQTCENAFIKKTHKSLPLVAKPEWNIYKMILLIVIRLNYIYFQRNKRQIGTGYNIFNLIFVVYFAEDII
jgi:hypothetical protein